MTERPNLVLGTLLGIAATVGALVAGGLLVLGSEGAEAIGATLVGALSACVFFLLGLEQIPFSSLAIVLFALASLAGLARTLRAYRRESRLLRALALEPIEEGPLFVHAARQGVRLCALRSTRAGAFCFGLRRPSVVATTGLLERLDPDEQEAALIHELAHVRNREPLKCLLARMAAQTFFWLPALGALLERYLLVKELAADRESIAETSRPALAGALSQVLAHPTPAGAVGMAELASVRVDRLFEPDARLPRLIRPWQLIVSALAAGLLVLALAFPAALGPKQSQEMLAMLSTMSLHGLPGMLAGLGMNVAAIAGVTALARRVAR